MTKNIIIREMENIYRGLHGYESYDAIVTDSADEVREYGYDGSIGVMEQFGIDSELYTQAEDEGGDEDENDEIYQGLLAENVYWIAYEVTNLGNKSLDTVADAFWNDGWELDGEVAQKYGIVTWDEEDW